jgi:hypothetical protein
LVGKDEDGRMKAEGPRLVSLGRVRRGKRERGTKEGLREIRE